MDHSEFILLLKKYREGEATEQEMAILESWYLSETLTAEEIAETVEYEQKEQQIWEMLAARHAAEVKPKTIKKTLNFHSKNGNAGDLYQNLSEMEPSKLNVEDLLADSTFCEYCLRSNEESVAYWTAWVLKHPEQESIILQARALYAVLNAGVSDEAFEVDHQVFRKGFEQHTGLRFQTPSDPDNSQRKFLPPIYSLYKILTAAAACLILAVGVYLYNHPKTATNISSSGQVYYSPPGQRKSWYLPDGTFVRLNSGSRLSLLPGYNLHKREVHLEGEAYFIVMHEPKKQFLVHTTQMDVNDLGTVFNVKAYSSDKTAEAVLIKGAIEVIVKNNMKRRILLTPNKKVVILKQKPEDDQRVKSVNNENLTYKVDNVTDKVFKNAIVETDWTANKLSFYDQPFEDIAPMLSRWYGMQLIISNQQFKNTKFTGTFDHQSIEQVLDMLKLTSNFSYRKEGNVITIY